jgi:hypothetical protein
MAPRSPARVDKAGCSVGKNRWGYYYYIVGDEKKKGGPSVARFGLGIDELAAVASTLGDLASKNGPHRLVKEKAEYIQHDEMIFAGIGDEVQAWDPDDIDPTEVEHGGFCFNTEAKDKAFGYPAASASPAPPSPEAPRPTKRTLNLVA